MKGQASPMPLARLSHLFPLIGLFVLLLLHPCPAQAASHTLSDLAADLADDLADNAPASPSRPLIFVSSNRFADPHTKNIHPFASYLAAELRSALAREKAFAVTDDPLAKADLVLAGDYYLAGGKIVVASRLVRVDKTGTARDVASARGEMARSAAEPGWFAEDAKSKMLFLMSRLQDKAALALAMQSRPTVLVQPFGYEQGRLHSPFSDYLSGFALDFLTESDLLCPLLPPEAEANTRGAPGTRNIVAVAREAAVADAAGASHTIAGSYWPAPGGALDIKASLMDRSGRVLAAESVSLPESCVAPELLVLPQKKDTAFMADLSAWGKSTDAGPLSVELQTQKGRSSLAFCEGEDLVFLFTVSRPAYVRVFNRGADGAIYQIFPNEFDDGARPLPAGTLAAIPDRGYAKGFEFIVAPPLGNELVTIFASDKPLPELSSTDLGVHGLRRMNLTAEALRQGYEKHCLQHGQRLATDTIALTTQAKP